MFVNMIKISSPKTRHVRFRPQSGVWRLCNFISVGSGLPVCTLQSSFPSSQSCDTTEFLAFLVLFFLAPCLLWMFLCRIIWPMYELGRWHSYIFNVRIHIEQGVKQITYASVDSIPEHLNSIPDRTFHKCDVWLWLYTKVILQSLLNAL